VNIVDGSGHNDSTVPDVIFLAILAFAPKKTSFFAIHCRFEWIGGFNRTGPNLAFREWAGDDSMQGQGKSHFSWLEHRVVWLHLIVGWQLLERVISPEHILNLLLAIVDPLCEVEAVVSFPINSDIEPLSGSVKEG